MATWSLKITVKDVATKRVSVVGTRTDGEDIRTYSILDAIIATDPQKTAVLDSLWGQYEADVTQRTAVATIVDALEEAGATNLNNRETV